MSTQQGDMTISQYFTKVKSICNEIAKLDSESAINDARKRRIIIHGLNLKHGIVIATKGWANEPNLTELENILANQENLGKQMSKVSINEQDKTLFAKKKVPKKVNTITRFNKGESSRSRQGWKRGRHGGDPQ
jgi:hypothetical protein